MFADKYLKKRYLLPQKGHTRSHIYCLSEKRAHALRVSLLTQIASSQGKIVALAQQACDARPGCTRNARNAARAHEYTSTIDRVIARLRTVAT
jgi:hypothetical protein